MIAEIKWNCIRVSEAYSGWNFASEFSSEELLVMGPD
jgi:hypothetical protein